MNKINKILYNKLLLQAQEARDQNLSKLSDGIFNCIGSYPADAEDKKEKFSYTDLNSEVYKILWKICGQVMRYYNVNAVNAEKMHQILEDLTEEVIENIEENIDISNNNFEDKVIGEIE